jgi:molybdopterin-containing oxidoreductase family membrane subunit
MVSCNVITPQLFWFKRCRQSIPVMMAVAFLVNVGMWFERFVIVVTSLSADYLPANWGMYWPTWVEVLTLLGSFGLFFTLFLLFIRFLPMIAMAEVKTVLPAARAHGHGPGHGHRHGSVEPAKGKTKLAEAAR